MRPICAILNVLLTAVVAAEEPRIDLVEFRIEPMEARVGEPLTLFARAEATGVTLGSFLLRTAEDVRKEELIPGFPLYANGRYYAAENGRYFLMDNGSLDRDPRDQAFAIRIDTQGWKEGGKTFAFFASCRPSGGPFVATRRDFTVTVHDGRVRVEDLGATPLQTNRVVAGFRVEPATVESGDTVVVTLDCNGDAVTAVQLTDPFYIAEADTLPGFRYDEEKKKSLYPPALRTGLDGDRVDRAIGSGPAEIEIDTTAWPSGVHHLQLDVIGRSGKLIDYRSFAIKVRDPTDRLEVAVEDSRLFAEGTHFGRFLPLVKRMLQSGEQRLADGAALDADEPLNTLLCEDRYSSDGGRTWHGPNGGFGVGGQQLRDGRVVGFEYRCLPQEGSTGWYTVERSVSTDGGRSFQKSQARVHVPEATAAMGHGPHVGPVFMRSIVQRDDGSLVGLFAGWFKSDTALCPYGRGRPYSRTYVCQADCEGLDWRYLTTIGYDRIGSEGYNEGAMRRLPDGRLFAVIRTGNERDFNCQDNPIMWSESRDEGRTWSVPRRTGLEGAYPGLAVLSDSRLVISYGRPGAMIAFSDDGGRTWTDRTVIDATPYSGYTDVVEVAPGELLVGFGAKGFLEDPAAGVRTDQLRLATVRYREKP